MKFILGKKIGMTRVFSEEGESLPATLIEAGPCTITQIKNEDNDGYSAVQIGFMKKKESKMNNPQKSKPFRYLREFQGLPENKVGEEISVGIFSSGDKVKVSGTSKGKGFAGVMKRWNFSGLPATHGTKHEGRKGGSIGSAFPQRVVKGKKMAGRMGADKVSVKNLEIISVDEDSNVILVKGAVPGRNGALLTIQEV